MPNQLASFAPSQRTAQRTVGVFAPILFIGALFLSACAAKPEPQPKAFFGPYNYAPHYSGEAASESTVLYVSRPPDTMIRPAVVVIHGGGWSGGEPKDMNRFVEYIVQSGWVAINMGYRLAPDHSWPAQRADLHAAFEEIHRRAPELGIDPDRIAVLGYSAGAHLAAVVGTNPNPRVPRPVAVVAGAGPFDLTEMDGSKLVRQFLGGSKTLLGEGMYRDASPLRKVTANTPPMWFWHGTWDLTVDIDQSRRMAKALEQVGVEAFVRERSARGHITNAMVDADFWAEIDAFLRPKLESSKP